MLHHIYPRDQAGNGISRYGAQIDEIVGSDPVAGREIWHFELGYGGWRELWAADDWRKRHPNEAYVVTLHDPPVVCGKPFERFIGSRSFGAKVVRKVLDWTFGRLVVRRVVRGARRVIVLNRLAGPVVVKRFGLRREQVVALPHLPSLDQPAERPVVPSGPVRLLQFGVLVPRKGVEDLLAAFAQVADSSKAELTIFGAAAADNPGYEDRLQVLARQLGVADRVRFTGYGDNAAMRRAIEASTVVVLPYHSSDVIHASGPLLTAMALGRATVASDLAIFRDELEGEQYGRLCPARDVAALAQQLRSLVADPAEAERMGVAAYEHVYRKHSPDIIKQLLTDVYRSL